MLIDNCELIIINHRSRLASLDGILKMTEKLASPPPADR